MFQRCVLLKRGMVNYGQRFLKMNLKEHYEQWLKEPTYYSPYPNSLWCGNKADFGTIVVDTPEPVLTKTEKLLKSVRDKRIIEGTKRFKIKWFRDRPVE